MQIVKAISKQKLHLCACYNQPNCHMNMLSFLKDILIFYLFDGLQLHLMEESLMFQSYNSFYSILIQTRKIFCIPVIPLHFISEKNNVKQNFCPRKY
jgi:hypothetical protein